MLFIPNQAAMTNGTRITTQMMPALWMKVSVPAGILPMKRPRARSRALIPTPPKTATVITKGMRICIVVTPKLPSPAFIPSE